MRYWHMPVSTSSPKGIESHPVAERFGYRDLADYLRDWVRAQPAGTRLPSERDLAVRHGTSRLTAARAIGLLRAEGLLDVAQGSGAFVRQVRPLIPLVADRLTRGGRASTRIEATGQIAEAGLHEQVEVRIARLLAPPDVAARLRLTADIRVLVRHRVIGVNGHPLRLAISYLPLALVEGTAICRHDTGPGGTYARLGEILAARRHGGRLAWFREEVTTRMPAPDEAAALELAEGVPLIRVARTASDELDAPVEVRDILLASDRYRLVYGIPAD